MIITKNSKIYISGHQGLVGSSILRSLKKKGYKNLIIKSHNQLELENQLDTFNFFLENKPEVVFMAAAKVGGINANNTYPADFLIKNIQIQTNIFQSAISTGVKKLFFLGSSCIYPKKTKQPIKEDSLLTGSLEMSNRPYAISKISGIEACWSYNRQHFTNWLAVMPTNLYGPGDNYNLENSHVLPALINKIHEAKLKNNKKVIIWGSGKPMREFLHVDDLANCLIYLLELNEEKFFSITHKNICPLINIGTGYAISIINLAKEIASIIDFKGEFVFDTNMPDGTFQKCLDVSRIKSLGWTHKISLKEGLRQTYEDFKKNI